MFSGERWECFNVLEHYFKEKGIDLHYMIMFDESCQVNMDESAKIYAGGGAYIEGVKISISSDCDSLTTGYFTPLPEYNSDIDIYLSELESRGYSCKITTLESKALYVLIDTEDYEPEKDN